MELNHLKSSISISTGILAIIIFSIFTFTAFALFPGHYTPITNWLSDLGNLNLNPSGFIFFNIGCILTGLILIPFFIGLSKWYASKRQKNMLIVAQIIGIFSAFALIMVGTFPEDTGIKHTISACSFFISLLLVLIIANISLLNHPKFKKWIGYYGFFAAMVDLTLIILIVVPTGLPTPLVEWLAVFISLSWIGLLVYNMKSL
jgi:hypothetical membrane protein